MTDLKWTPVTIRLGQVKPWQDNPRMSTKAQAERLIQSERELGQVQTIAIGPAEEDGRYPLYDGHQRYAAWFTVKGASYELTALQSNRPLTEDERRKMAILLHTASGGWAWDKMAGWQVGELKEWGLVNQENIKGWNTDANNVKELLAAEKETQDAEPQTDRAAELLERWGVKTGDLWQIGEHRLICGDCTDAAVVARVMQNERATLAPVDPPYNVGFEYDGETVDDEKTEEKYKEFTLAWFDLCQSVSDNQIVTPAFANIHRWMRYFDAPKHIGAWIKTNAGTRGSVCKFSCFEPVVFYGDKFGNKRINDVFSFPVGQNMPNGESFTGLHPCPKPLKMWEDLVENYSKDGDIIFESFAGTGTTLVACQNLGRRGRAIEISPAYCAVTLQRMSDAFPELEIRRLE